MPCNSDHMEQRPDEAALQKAGELLLFVVNELGERGSDQHILASALHSDGREYYAKDVGQVEALCKALTEMPEADREAIVYNAHSKESRRLANWWERHQEVDRKREELEGAAARKAALRESARAKLNADERKAVGLD